MLEQKKAEGSKEWWNEKYASSSDYLYGKAPADFLVSSLPTLKKGSVLDVGMGEGRNAIYLAQKGFDVLGIDFSETATSRAKTLAQNSGVTIDIKTQDLTFFIVPLMKYASIVLSHFKAPLTTLKTLTRGLEAGGTLLIEAFLTQELKSHGAYKPDLSECYHSNELLDYVKELQILYYSELPTEKGEHKVRLLAKKNIKFG